MVSASVNCTSVTEARMVWVRSLTMSTWIAGGSASSRRGSAALMRSTVSMTLAPGCLKMTRKMPRLPFAHAACLAFSGPSTAVPMSRMRTGAAVAVGDDDVVPVLRREQLVVGVDRVAARADVDASPSGC